MRKVFSHKYDENEHEIAKKFSKKFSVTLDQYINSAVKTENNKNANNPPAVIEHNVVKFREVLNENVLIKRENIDLKRQLVDSKKLETSWKEAYNKKVENQDKESRL